MNYLNRYSRANSKAPNVAVNTARRGSKMSRKPIYLACLLLAACVNQQVDCSEGSPAQNWVESVESQDWARMTELLAPDATYDDPTVIHFDGQDAISLKGREAVVEFWKKTSEEIGARNIDYDITRCFESGGITVLTMKVSLTMSGAYWNINKESIDLTGEGTTVVTNRPEGIVAVVDYFDYAGTLTQIERLRSQYGEARDSDSTP